MRLAILVLLLSFCFCPQTVRAAAPPKATISAELNETALLSGQRAVIAVKIDVPEGFHAQSHTPLEANLIPLVVSVTSDSNFTADAPIYPAPKIENYPLLGKVSVYTGQVTVFVPITIANGLRGPVHIEGGVTYQICDDKQCYIPQRKPLPFMVDADVQPNRIGEFDDGHKNPAFARFDWNLLKAVPATLMASSIWPAS